MNDLDLIVALAAALRAAEQERDAPRARAVLATLKQELHVLGLVIDPASQTCPALIRYNGHLWEQGLEKLGIRPDNWNPPNTKVVA